MNETQRKYYSFFNTKTCVGSKGNTYIGVTVEGIPMKVGELKTVMNGTKNVVNFVLPIKNREQKIERACGLAPNFSQKGEDVTVWAKCSIWGSINPQESQTSNTATRFVNWIAQHPNTVVVLTGSIKVVTNTSEKDGNTYNDCIIDADDFFVARQLQNNSGYQQQNNGGYQQPQQNNGGYQQQGSGGYQPPTSIPDGRSGFTEISNTEIGDLPF